MYSTPTDTLAVAEALGIGEHGRYLLAATFGNVQDEIAGPADHRPGDAGRENEICRMLCFERIAWLAKNAVRTEGSVREC
jgi:hypothetical protein